MASWGKAKLSSTALQRIQEVNKALTEDHLPGIRGNLLRNVLEQEPKPSPKPFGLLMDLPKPQTLHISAPVDENPPLQAIDVHDLATKIVKIVCNGQSSISLVIDLVSKVTDDHLGDLVMDCWSLLVQDDHKKSFVVAMSATRTTALCVGSKILLPLLSKSEAFQSTIQIYGPVFGWLEGNFSQSTVVPLLLHEQSAINQDPNSWKILLNHLSESQKTEAVVVFCRSIQELQEWHLQSLSIMLESPPIDSAVVQPVISMLSTRMDHYSENRLVGKIILTLISFLGASTSHQVYSEVSSLASHFKGPLRFRHKQALAKVLSQVQPN